MRPLALRPLALPQDRTVVAELWRSSLPPSWPVLPGALDLLRTGHLAERDGRPVGVVATDGAGAVTFLAVAPAWRRRGVGRELVERAVDGLRDPGATPAGSTGPGTAAAPAAAVAGAASPDRVTAGGGPHGYVWPGVPTDCPAGLAFFDRLGWPEVEVVTDLVQDLGAPGTDERLAAFAPPRGVRVEPAGPADRDAVLAFEDATFPQWSRSFRRSWPDVLVARDRRGAIAGTLLLRGPGRVSLYWPLLGEDCATVSCVGVAPDQEGRGVGTALVAAASRILAARGVGTCLIDWVVRVAFYARLGYRPWRAYSVRRLPA